jgi:hypothetical protein
MSIKREKDDSNRIINSLEYSAFIYKRVNKMKYEVKEFGKLKYVAQQFYHDQIAESDMKDQQTIKKRHNAFVKLLSQRKENKAIYDYIEEKKVSHGGCEIDYFDNASEQFEIPKIKVKKKYYFFKIGLHERANIID